MLQTQVNTMLYVNYISLKKKKLRNMLDMKLKLRKVRQLAMAQDKQD